MSAILSGHKALESFEDCWIERPIMARFEMAAAFYAEKIAVDDGNLRLTYSEMRSAVHHLAHRIEQVAPLGTPIGILLSNGALFPAAMLACLAAGRICVPIDLSYPNERNEQIVRDAGTAALIVHGKIENSHVAPVGLPRLDITESLYARGQQFSAFAPANCPAIVLYTSGSTGRPKGICNDQRAISQRVAQFTKTCHLNNADRFILLSSPSTIAGMRDTFAALLNGATLYIADPHVVGISGIIRTLQEKEITVCYAVPALLRALLTLPGAKRACHALRILRLGGDIVLASDIVLWQRFLDDSCRLLIGYGSTEVPTAFQWFVPNDWTIEGSRVPIGYAQPGISITLVNDDGNPAMAGETGELVLECPYLALGNWQNGRLMPGAFRTSLDDPAMRIVHTGDLVRLSEDGLAEFVGRKDRVIKVRGKHVDLVEIEEVLRSCDDITDTAIVWRADDQNPALVAYVVSDSSETRFLVERLHAVVAARLPGHMRPTQFQVVDAIPRLPNLKPDVQALASFEAVSLAALESKHAYSAELSKDSAAPSRIGLAVEKAWADVLDRHSFVANLPWDQAGGDSLKALRLWFLIEEALDKTLPLDELESSATPRELIAAIEKLFDTRSTIVVSGQDVRPLVFLMPPFGGDTPSVARFRAAFGGKLRFVVPHYLSWREMCRAGARFDLIVDDVLAQVVAKLGKNECILAGYSFGGFVAWDVARRLMETGHRVAFVGLIDARRQDLLDLPKRRGIAKLRLTVIRLLIDKSAFRMLQAAGNLAMLLPGRTAFWFHSRLIEQLRTYALRNSDTKPVHMPVTLFRSDEHSLNLPDYGWGGLCAKLDIIPIGGSHASILEPPYRALLCKRFMEAIQCA
jgi:acyl-coenzyme A synthetase/AMP-(fatty) acid ligase/thioesterase domain-containing protein